MDIHMQYGNQYTYIDDAELVPFASAGPPSLRPAVPSSLSTCPSIRGSFCPRVYTSDAPRILWPAHRFLAPATRRSSRFVRLPVPWAILRLVRPRRSHPVPSSFRLVFDLTVSLMHSYLSSSALGSICFVLFYDDCLFDSWSVCLLLPPPSLGRPSRSSFSIF